MITFSLDELHAALRRRALRVVGAAPTHVVGVSTDSRRVGAGSLFAALAGDRFDAHEFVESALAAGAGAALVARPVHAAGPQFVVDDVLAALQDLAAWHLDRLSALRIALTGSNGKTSTKELVRAALAGGLGPDAVVATAGNLNNHIGVPLTAFTVERRHAVAVFEMGMNHLGEIARLAEIVRPTVGLITNVGTAHAGNVGGIEGVMEAKGELFAGLAPGGIAVVNADDARCVTLAARRRGPTVSFALERDADVRAAVRAQGPSGIELELRHAGRTVVTTIPVVGRHHARNAAGAVAMAMASGVAFDRAARGLKDASVPGGRLAWKVRGDDVVILDDTYNANPDSVAAALATLRELAGARRMIVVLGDMLELGDDAPRAHTEIGTLAAKTGAHAVFGAGPLASSIVDAARAAGIAHDDSGWAADSGALASSVAAYVKAGDIVLIKGSRGARMERVVAALVAGGA